MKWYILICSTIGRPRLSVDVKDIEFLRSLHFSWTKIAEILGVSRSTLYRRLDEQGISRDTHYSDISDFNLDTLVQAIKVAHPNDGERLMIGHLFQHGVTIPRARLRASIHRVDSEGTRERRSVTIRRRVYHSEGPNAMWHIDGHHKLIRWRLVIHGGVDGYSRVIVYLLCSDNNRANTVLSAFTDAAQAHGLPNQVRSDLGGENMEVWRYMTEQHSSNDAVITGSSTHNQRIERMWRDVHRCVGVLFADTFRTFEEERILNPLNEVDIFCLHYVYIPRINSALNGFTESWNNHALSTAQNLTPNQLFLRGAIARNMTPQLPRQTVASQLDQTVSATDLEHVAVPRVRFRPCPTLQTRLRTVDPLRLSDNFGADIYHEVVDIVGSHLTSGCSHCI